MKQRPVYDLRGGLRFLVSNRLCTSLCDGDLVLLLALHEAKVNEQVLYRC